MDSHNKFILDKILEYEAKSHANAQTIRNIIADTIDYMENKNNGNHI